MHVYSYIFPDKINLSAPKADFDRLLLIERNTHYFHMTGHVKHCPLIVEHLNFG